MRVTLPLNTTFSKSSYYLSIRIFELFNPTIIVCISACRVVEERE